MSTLVWSLILAVLSLAFITLQKTYGAVPLTELKRRARDGDKGASTLHKAAAHRANLRLLLWCLTGASTTTLFVVIARNAPTLTGPIGIALFIWIAFGWIAHARVSSFDVWLARQAAPALGMVLGWLQPVLSPLSRAMAKYYHPSDKTALYEKEDLVALLKQQKKLTHNRINKEELDIAVSTLGFGDKQVADVLIPRRVVKTVSAVDSVGPVFLDELHKSGHSRFPVYEGKKDHLVGMLYVRDLVDARSGGSVKNFMKKDVYYVKEDQPLAHVLDAFLKTKHHLFIVVNNFEEMVGIITIEDILEQILGKPIVDEFDHYDDLRAVAAYEAKKDEGEHHEATNVPEAEQDDPKVDK